MLAILAWLVETTLKASLLIVLVALLQRAIGRHVDPRWRHVLWVIVLVRLLMPDVPSSSISVFNLMPARSPAVSVGLPDPAVAAGPTTPVHRVVQPSRSLAIARWVFAIWLLGAIALAIRTLIVAMRMHLSVRRIAPASGRRSLDLVETDIVKTPALYGLFRPVLLLPRGLTEAEVSHVVLHETWHLKRMDVAVSWLLAAAQILHWFNPLVWYAASRIREERELSCDELALSLLQEDERPSYGRTILKLLQRFATAAPVPALVGMVSEKQKMKRRITMIASFRNRTRFTMLFLILAGAVGAAGLTDGERRARIQIKKELNPAVLATVERLENRVSFELTNATLSDLLGVISNKIGMPVLQSPEIAAHPVQKARFTLKADNVPAHMALMEALIPFSLSADPTADAVTIVNRPAKMRVERHRRSEEEEMIRRDETTGEERVIIRKMRNKEATFDGSGKLRREMTVDLELNGEKTTGKLTIEIQK